MINQPIAMPTYVNLFWDTSWDTDNPTLKVATVDTVTRAVVQSSYFMSLSEYGVGSVSYAGSFLPDPNCPAKAPNSVGFYDPFNTSIAGFVQCEHDHGPAILQQNNVIYNVILPPTSVESDFWTSNFCTGVGSPVAWHYHGLEDTPPFPFGGGPFSGQPIYTIVLTNPACGGNGGFFDSLTHEMVEAATDPFPVDISIIPPHINISTQNEIADFCEGTGVKIFADSSGTTPMDTPVSLTTYWSNARQSCVSFGDLTQPIVSNVAVSNWGSQTAFAFSGSGFGSMPAQVVLPNMALPYLEVKNTTQNWEAGNILNGDTIPLLIANWSATLVSNVGFDGVAVNNVPGVPITAWLCNPSSLKCNSHATVSAPGPYNPRLHVLNVVDGQFTAADTITISRGTQQVMTHTVQGRCSPCIFSASETLPAGSYSFTQTVTGPTVMKHIGNGCQQIVLASGEETSCEILDVGPPVIIQPPPHCFPNKPCIPINCPIGKPCNPNPQP